VSARPEKVVAQASRLFDENQKLTGGTPVPLHPEKILALQFKYFGDAVLMTPALRALRGYFPNAELHLLAPEEIAPLFQHLPWLNRVWSMPRRRGRASLGETWPLLRALRREQFDRSVDFASNDRGALLSRFIGAKKRLGWDIGGGFLGRKFCYTDRVVPEKNPVHESALLARLLSGWQIPPPAALETEIRPDPALATAAREILPHDRAIICHVASSQPRKEWPLAHWAEFHRLATAAGRQVVFTTARGERESALMAELKKLAPAAQILPLIAELSLFLAVLARAGVFVSGDTGPLHFAAGLGVPTISLFGPTSPARWAPIGEKHRILTSGLCTCEDNTAICTAPRHCLSTISPAQVSAALEQILKTANR
jgi:heptosyltransferase-3